MPWFNWALGLFLLASIMGLAMRYVFVGQLPGLYFSNLKHGHSHVAMLGWSVLVSAGLLIAFFVRHSRHLPWYRLILGANVVSAVGMAVSFTIQGYGLYSISFSTLHILTAYFFAWAFYRDMRNNDTHPVARKFALWSVFWMLFSTIGIWAIAPVDIMLGRLHPLYYMSIQWFLHFQLMGWFTYVVLAALYKYLHNKGYNINIPNYAFWMFQVSLMLTYALSVSWSTPGNYLFYFNAVGVVLQLFAVWIMLKPVWHAFKAGAFSSASFMGYMVLAGIAILALRVAVQLAVVFPAVAVISYTIRWYVVAFIHLVMLGTFTFMAAGLMGSAGYLTNSKISRIGWGIFFIGFLITELLMFVQGTMLWMRMGFMPWFHQLMFYFSSLFPFGLLLVVWAQFFQSRKPAFYHSVKPLKNF